MCEPIPFPEHRRAAPPSGAEQPAGPASPPNQPVPAVPSLRRGFNKIEIKGDFAFVHLTKGQIAVIDSDDASIVSNYCWAAHKGRYCWYARARRPKHEGLSKYILMHRLILGEEKGKFVDHANKDGLDNRRKNIRWASPRQNAQNRKMRRDSSHRLKGVRWREEHRVWYARIAIKGKRLHLGSFKTEEEAHSAYCEAAMRYHKEYASTK